MSQSDGAAWAALVERVEKLEARLEELARGYVDMHQELFGSSVDHADERAERAALAPRRK
jgi:uncharacterized protein (UPF0335 family)